MPSVSKKQEKLMRIAAHKPGGFGGVSQTVARDFEAADKAKQSSRKPLRAKMYGEGKTKGK